MYRYTGLWFLYFLGNVFSELSISGKKYVVILRKGIELQGHTRLFKSTFRSRSASVIDVYTTLGNIYLVNIIPNLLPELQRLRGVKKVIKNPKIIRQTLQRNASWGLARLSNVRKLPRNGPYDFEYSCTGNDVTVYIMDSGLKENPIEFGNRAQLIKMPRDVLDEIENGHGTHVAGIVGSKTYGVAKECSIKMFKDSISSRNGLMEDYVFKAFDNILKDRLEVLSRDTRAITAILNISSRFDDHEDEKIIIGVIRRIADEGKMLVVLSAGNQGIDNSDYPGVDIPGILVVAASNIKDQLWEHSNYGRYVNIAAPGENVISLGFNPNVAIDTDYTLTAVASGTSQAAPYVAGLASCILSKNIGLKPSELKEKVLSLSRMNIPNSRVPSDTKLYPLAHLK